MFNILLNNECENLCEINFPFVFLNCEFYEINSKLELKNFVENFFYSLFNIQLKLLNEKYFTPFLIYYPQIYFSYEN